MNPNYNQTITLYHKEKDSSGHDVWTRSVVSQCFFKASTTIVQGGTESTKVVVSQANTYTVRIPYQNNENLCVSKDDIVVLGGCEDEITSKSPNTATEVLLRHKPNAFRVTAYADNTKFIGKHYRLGG